MSVIHENNDTFLTVRETAALLNVSAVTLRKYSKSRLIPYYKIGGKILYKKSEVIEAVTQTNNHLREGND